MSMSNHVYLHGVTAEKVKVEVRDGQVSICMDGREGSFIWVTLFTDEVAEIARKLGQAVISA